ncbi:MAG: tetratricopeptide repeat protein [Acidobacteria bacterium]|nr:tetratricopeptide repeat protein [Acidobacteriota bacterium]
MSDKKYIFHILFCAVLCFAAVFPLNAQTEDELVQATAKAMALIEQQRFAEAVPHLEVVVKAIPDDGRIRFLYGWSLLTKSKQVNNTEEAKQLSAKALEQLKEAKKLGLKDPALDSLLAVISGEPAADSDGPAYSLNAEAEKTMHQAEGLFAQSKYEEAAKLFEKVLTLDPKVYQAAVSGGDCFVQKGDWATAEKWYQRAITIDPNRETAYRYSATPFMKQKKYDQARERYIEAYIVEPYNRMSSRGIDQWSEITGKELTHPAVNVPEFIFDAKGKAAPKSAIDPKDPDASPWLAYFAARESWKNEKFAKVFPKEKEYRHSLAEEADSLRAAVKAAQTGKSSSKHFETLSQLDKEGLLEAYILLARANEGIAEDHPEYLKNNRPKLRQYVANYVIQK